MQHYCVFKHFEHVTKEICGAVVINLWEVRRAVSAAVQLRVKEIGYQYMHFFISTQKHDRGYQKKFPMERKMTKMQN